jgi:hypothetical protein
MYNTRNHTDKHHDAYRHNSPQPQQDEKGRLRTGKYACDPRQPKNNKEASIPTLKIAHISDFQEVKQICAETSYQV